MRIWKIASGTAAAAAALFGATAAAAGPRYYFNKPGVAREAYMADILECGELAGGARAKDVFVPYSPNPWAAGAGAFFGALMRGAETRRLRASVERTCMADKGYRRMEVETAIIKEIEKLPDGRARLERLFALAASDKPIGKRVPE
jgi:hypothetical protein